MTDQPQGRPAALIRTLGLDRHPEGGHFRRVFTSAQPVQHEGRTRPAASAIYYLLCPGEFSRWHVFDSDELWIFLEGGPVELVTFDPATQRAGRRRLGRASDLATPLAPVTAGVWQAARPLDDYGLVACTVAPAFEFEALQFVADLPDHRAAFEGPLKDWLDLL